MRRVLRPLAAAVVAVLTVQTCLGCVVDDDNFCDGRVYAKPVIDVESAFPDLASATRGVGMVWHDVNLDGSLRLPTPASSAACCAESEQTRCVLWKSFPIESACSRSSFAPLSAAPAR